MCASLLTASTCLSCFRFMFTQYVTILQTTIYIVATYTQLNYQLFLYESHMSLVITLWNSFLTKTIIVYHIQWLNHKIIATHNNNLQLRYMAHVYDGYKFRNKDLLYDLLWKWYCMCRIVTTPSWYRYLMIMPNSRAGQQLRYYVDCLHTFQLHPMALTSALWMLSRTLLQEVY